MRTAYEVNLCPGGNTNPQFSERYETLEAAQAKYDEFSRGDVNDPNDSDWADLPPKKELLEITIDDDGEDQDVDVIDSDLLTPWD